MNKKLWVVGLLAGLVLVAAACNKQTNSTPTGDSMQTQPASSDTMMKDQTPDTQGSMSKDAMPSSGTMQNTDSMKAAEPNSDSMMKK